MIILDPDLNDPLAEKKPDSPAHSAAPENDDVPPPYEPITVPATEGAPPIPPRRETLSESQSIFQPRTQQLVNHLYLFAQHDPITGTYLIDPELPDPAKLQQPTRRGDRHRHRHWHGHRMRGGRSDHRHGPFGDDPRAGTTSDADADAEPGRRHFFRKRGPEINAAFRTRHGNISLDLAIVATGAEGAASDKGQKTVGRVTLSSHHGRIDINLLEIQESRSVDLDASTRSGNISVLFPATFSGPVTFRARGGVRSVHFLPAFAERAHLVQGSDREIVVALSPSSAPQSPPTAPEGEDCCYIGTRHGRITVGISGLDELPAATSAGNGLIGKLEAFVEASAKQLGTLVEAKAKEFGSWVEASAKALETTITGEV